MVAEARSIVMSVAILFTLPSSTVVMNAPVYFDLEIVNDLSDKIAVDLGHNSKASLSFKIKSTGGSVVQVPPLSSQGLGSIGRVQIDTHGRYKRAFLLNEWYTFPAPGEYEIEGQLNTPIVSISGEEVRATSSSTMKLTVTAADPQALSKIAEQLLAQLAKTTDAEARADLSLALSHIQDPVVVPYIREGLKQNTLSWQYAIPGLARIGNPEARDLLNEIKERGDDEAGSALARFFLEAASNEELQRRLKNPYR